jgi:hypothetical protein
MTKDELRSFVTLIDFTLHQTEIQSSMARMILQRFECLDVLQKVRDQLANLSDDNARIQLLNKLEALENEATEKNALLCSNLEDALARGESATEQIEAIAAQLKVSLEE